MSTYDWTVVLPSLNEGRRVLETVVSVLQTAGDALVEVVVVDDHSDDYSCYDVARAYADDDRVRVVSGLVRLGVGQARNLGGLIARGNKLWFLDAHSRTPEGWPQQLEAAMYRCGQDVLYGTALRPLVDDPEEQERAATAYGVRYDTRDLNEHYYPPREQTDRPYPVMGLPGGSMLMTRALWEELGGFDAGLMPPWGQENMELCMRAWLTGHEVRIVPDCVVLTYYKDSAKEANPGIKSENLLYNRVRIALLYLGRKRTEKVMNDLRHQEWFAEAIGLLMYERLQSLHDRSIAYKINPDDLFERFGVDW